MADDSSGVQTTSTRPRAGWALAELILALLVIVAGLEGFIPFSSTPWLLVLASLFLWWRGPGWRGVGMRWPRPASRVLLLGLVVGIGYQFVGLYVIEPVLARATTGALPDVTMFRPLIGDEGRLAFWLLMSWTMAALMEEMVFRGWMMDRFAECANFSRAAWPAAVVGSSALFGAVHLYQGASGVLATGLSGVVFACLYLATGRNLWSSILAHGFMDTAGFVMIYLGVYPGL